LPGACLLRFYHTHKVRTHTPAEIREMTRKAESEQKTKETAARNFERIEQRVRACVPSADCPRGLPWRECLGTHA